MKTIFAIALATAAVLGAITANAKTYSTPRYMIGLNADLAKKFYSYRCTETLCGNWNVK